MVSRLIKNIARDIVIVVGGIIVIWIGLQVYFDATNPFYVVNGESMYPKLKTWDIVVVTENQPFEYVKEQGRNDGWFALGSPNCCKGIGDIIVFNRPSDHNVTIARVVAIIDDDPRTLRTQGDNNKSSIPGTDYPITEKEYIGTVIHVVPQVGYLFQSPGQFIMIAVIVGIIAVVEKQILKNKKRNQEMNDEDQYNREQREAKEAKDEREREQREAKEAKDEREREQRERVRKEPENTKKSFTGEITEEDLKGTYYDLLYVPKGASQKEIKMAYRKLISKYHPDKNPNDQFALKISKKLNVAYSVLSNQVKRKNYDEKLDQYFV